MSGMKDKKKTRKKLFSRNRVLTRFRRNKLALMGAYFILVLTLIALLADFIAYDKPIIAKFDDHLTSPIMLKYGVALGISEWPEGYHDVQWKEIEYDFAIWPLVRYMPYELDYNNVHSVGPWETQSIKSNWWRHWLGTDELGRDTLSGLIHGTRIALSVGIIAMAFAMLIGLFFGGLAGFYGDDKFKLSRARLFSNLVFFLIALFYAFVLRQYALADALANSIISFLGQLLLSILIFLMIMLAANLLALPLKKIPVLSKKITIPMDLIISRIIELFVTVPTLIFIMALVTIAKPSIFLVMVVIGLTSWTGIARFVRAELLKTRTLEYIEAAKALGFSSSRMFFHHALPNSISPVIISLAFGIAVAILIESTLSFLGIGITETVTWGSLLAAARSTTGAWWLALFPGIAIFLTVTMFNLIGDGLTDAFDPRSGR
ncbi:MAG: ABC transporter permease [Bacteroidetes bacterium]|nr:ABC transporter permease [Bacteroidota bacterium]